MAGHQKNLSKNCPLDRLQYTEETVCSKSLSRNTFVGEHAAWTPCGHGLIMLGNVESITERSQLIV